ncbi:hypothetical protein A2686_02665 [Candidatus Woesebacteria bacterium RIFCSPHIGHO2_01_FULL_38_10]|nr:MAG: hypothetical protein A2686_02665 [Candidatus Woesebacteria bacterium RIFCSPHIGHO2_01_FULL_38_10]
MDFSQITLFLVTSALFGLLAKFLKQPLLIGYLFAGVILAGGGFIKDISSLSNLGKIGVTFLLFLLGLEIKLKEIPEIGKAALIIGSAQIFLTSLLAIFLLLFLGFGFVPSIYIAFALTFSSTIIAVKHLSEKNDLESLYGRITVGVLLLQDLVVVSILLLLSGLKGGNLLFQDFAFLLVKTVSILMAVWFVSKKILPFLFEKFIAASGELLFIVSCAWVLGISSLVAGPIGLSLEVGGFLAGLSLSSLPEHLQIAARTRPLRDFFLTLFFLYLGTRLITGVDIISLLPYAFVLCLFVLIVKPLIVLPIMGMIGYKRRTSLFTGLSIAQVSEFSFILLALGTSLGQVTEKESSLVILVGVFTMIASTYLMIKQEWLYRRLASHLRIFEKKKNKESALIEKVNFQDHLVLIGANRTGRSLINFFRKKGVSFLVVDFDPKVFSSLTAEGINVMFGDISDNEIIKLMNLDKAKMVISTTTNLEDNLTILEQIRGYKVRPASMMTVSTREEGIKLYEAGASYVIVPEVVAGEHIKHLLKAYRFSGERLRKMGKAHFNRLIFK